MKTRFFYLLFSLVFLFSCKKEEETPLSQNAFEYPVFSNIYFVMKDFYFWKDEMPPEPNGENFKSEQEFLDEIIYKPLDKWSYVTKVDEFQDRLAGRLAGHGFSWAFNEEDRLFIAHVYDEAPSGKDGWQRGWECLEINGKPIEDYNNGPGEYNFELGPLEAGITNTFKFLLPDGTTTIRENTKADYQANYVLHKDVYEINEKKVGYWVYRNFQVPPGNGTSPEVDETFQFFQQEEIDELIIDLRINTGGNIIAAEQVLNYVIQTENAGKKAYEFNFKTTRFAEDPVSFLKRGSLEFDKIYFLTTELTASASELVINTLTPYMDLILIGDITTGKPVGSINLAAFNSVLRNNNVELVPITFSTPNANGDADYFDGFTPDFFVGDSPQFNWGDRRDYMLQAALNHIENGNVGSRMTNTSYKPKWKMTDNLKGLDHEFPDN